MPKYSVSLTTGASTVIEVEAEDEQEAAELALNAEMPTICAQCAGWGSDANLELSDGWDVGAIYAI